MYVWGFKHAALERLTVCGFSFPVIRSMRSASDIVIVQSDFFPVEKQTNKKIIQDVGVGER